MLSVRIPLEILHMGGKLFIFFLLSHPIAREDAAIWRLDIILCSIFIKHISKTNWFLICQYQWKPNRKVILPNFESTHMRRVRIWRFFDFFTSIFFILTCIFVFSGTNLLCRISGDFVDFELFWKCDWFRFAICIFCYFLSAKAYET